MQKDLAHERKKAARVELKNAEMENKLFEQEKSIKNMEKKLDSTGTIEKQLQNLQPANDAKGNCKRCEALYVANGLYVEKINKLKKKLKV